LPAGVIVTLGIDSVLKGIVVDKAIGRPRPLDQSRVLLPSLVVGNDLRALMDLITEHVEPTEYSFYNRLGRVRRPCGKIPNSLPQ